MFLYLSSNEKIGKKSMMEPGNLQNSI